MNSCLFSPRAGAVVTCVAVACVIATPVAEAALPEHAAVGVYVLGPKAVAVGTPVVYRVRAHWTTAPTISGVLPGARVSLWLRRGGHSARRLVARARTQGRGEASLAFTAPARAGKASLEIVVASALGTGRAARKIRFFADGRVLLTTDKPVYRPGETIRLRALALRGVDRKPLAKRALTFVIRDPRGTRLFEKRTETSSFGVASAALHLAREVNLGAYRIAVKLGTSDAEVAHRTVKVSRYRLPRFAVHLRTARPAYRPGQALEGDLQAIYFHGEPVAHAKVEVEASYFLCPETTWVFCRVQHRRFNAVTDERGRARFAFDLTTSRIELSYRRGRIDLHATVTDAAGARREAVASVPFSPQILRVALLLPHGALTRGAKNRLVVLASRVDGRPVQGAKVALRLAGQSYHLRTDDLGSAVVMTKALPKARSPSQPRPSVPKRLLYRPRVRNVRSCPAGSRQNDAVVIKVTTARGYTQEIRRCPPIIDGQPRLDVAHHHVLPDAAIDATFTIPGAVDASLAFCDVLKGSQSLASVSAPVHHGIARFRIPAPPQVDGLVVLRAYRLGARDARQSDRRVIWIEPRARLRVQMRLDRATYRPGVKARLSVHVTRSDTQRGVFALLGLRSADRALLALMPKDSEVSPLLFMLASWAQEQSAALPVRPGSRGLRAWLRRPGRAHGKRSRVKAKRRRALDLLLSVLRPPKAEVWETDPWQARQDCWETQRDAIVEAVKAGIKTLSLGQRTLHGWRFHRRCVHKLVQAKMLAPGSERDPWARVIWGLRLPALDASLNFPKLAAAVAQNKIDRVYGLLERFASKLPLERIRGFGKDAWLAILSKDLFARLRRLGHVPAQLFVDPWGHRLRIRHYRHTLVTLGESSRLSRAEVVSMGPDERLGTPDDVRYDAVRRHPIGKKGLAALLCRLCHCSKTRCAPTGCACSGGGYGGGDARICGRRSRSPQIVVGRASLRGGRRYRQPEAPRLRSRFPETLLWRPEVLTDSRGHAEVRIPLADNITTWKIFADASTKQGLFGAASVDLRVFQPFFVDVDLPRALTVGDHLALPVRVSNYTKRPLTATVKLASAPWYRLAGPATRMLTVAPGAVAVTQAEITVLQEGHHALRLTAHGRDSSGQTRVADAAERQSSVLPDGSTVFQTFSGVLATTLRQDVSLPPAMLPRSGRVALRLEAGPLSTTFEGLEGLLERPHGCFEQTSATVFPNLLVLDYLRRRHLATRKIERRALAYLADGYQRLLTFELPSGGFSWFGRAPANQVLTAYGLVEFSLLAKLRKVDPSIIARTRRWLIEKQKKDGSWRPQAYTVMEGVMDHKTKSRLRVTAYIAACLADSGYRGKALDRALAYLRPHAARAHDAYTLALLAHAWLGRKKDPLRRRLLDRLWAKRITSDKGPLLPGPTATLTHGAGRSGGLETTALGALIFARAGVKPSRGHELLASLMVRRGAGGAWPTTQTTILALRALLSDRRAGRLARGRIVISVDGKAVYKLRLRPKRGDVRRVDLSAYAGSPGDHRIGVRFFGQGRLRYRLTASHWMLRKGALSKHHGRRGSKARKRLRSKLAIATHFDRHTLRVGESLAMRVTVKNRGSRTLAMPLITVPLPPGFDLSPGLLESLVAAKLVSRVQLRGSKLVFYLEELAAGARRELPLTLRSRFPLKVRVSPSTVYAYYEPGRRAEGKAQRITVLTPVSSKRDAKPRAPRKTKARAKADRDVALDRAIAAMPTPQEGISAKRSRP